MIVTKLKINTLILNQKFINNSISLLNINKRFLFMKPGTGFNEDNNRNLMNLENIFNFNARQMKIVQNKIMLNQNHLGLKTTRNETYLVYQTEELNFFILGKKLLFFSMFLILIEMVRRYKKETTSKYILYTFFSGFALYALIHPRFSLSNSIKKIELNKSLDLIYVTFFNNKMIKVPNNSVYLNTNFRHMENIDSKRLLVGIKGKSYYLTTRFAYIPNFELFNCSIRGFQFVHDTQKF